ncbi:MAG: hypothetical protein NTZ96_02100 [Burkholderiales bacterium]|nr:hypothetical protein [Burkholderiales bacterium]
MLGLTARASGKSYTVTHARPVDNRSARQPTMRHRPARNGEKNWPQPIVATFYFDAAWQTSQTLRHLMHASLADETLGLLKPPELLMQAMETMLNSICPGFPDDADSLDCFQKRLQMHLSELTASELGQLQQLLKASRFDHVVIESIIDDFMMIEHGFANGPPHCRQRTLMFTNDLYYAIDEAIDTASRVEATLTPECRLTPAQAQHTRDLLATLSGQHARGSITLAGLADAANELARATGTSVKTDRAVAAHPLPPASSVTWQGGQLMVDSHALAVLTETKNGALGASLLRDLLELLLVHKLFGPIADLMTLSAGQRALLQREIEQVLSRPPSVTDSAISVRAAEVLARRSSFGTMQIFPTVGATLGHAWISPVLSVVPDKSRKGVEAGKRFMRSGLRLEPTQCTVNEWDIRWLSPHENNDMYPAAHAWHLTVPAHRLKLQQAAEQTREEWQRKKLPYRFIGTEPGMPATGCRATVWHASQHAMDDDTRSLFEHFTLGLPEPESPTELALRMAQFMRWLDVLGSRSVVKHGDL